MDKLEFFREVTFRAAAIVENEEAMKDLFLYLRKTIGLHALTWHSCDHDLKALRLRAAVTPEGAFNLDEQIVHVPEEAHRQSESLARKRWREVEHTSQDPLASILVKAMADLIGPEDKSLLITDLEWQGSQLGHLCMFRETSGPWPREHAEMCTMLDRPFSFATFYMHRFTELTDLTNRVTEEKELLVEELRRFTGHEMIGLDSGLREVHALIDQLAHVDSPVLIIGETGVGKELVADAIQQASPRRHGPYVKVNCGAIPDGLIDSELFGHEKGAFTGAVSARKGRFELANGGTIFLDEIGELPAQAQVRLLRVLQDFVVERVGGSKSIKVDVRFMAATNRDLMQMVRTGTFREDLFFRINVFPIIVPPLRQRKQDIIALTKHFMEKKAQDMKLRTIPRLDSNALQDLLEHNWPGNIRELENLVERALILRPKGPVSFGAILQSPPSSSATPYEHEEVSILSLDEANRRHIVRALTASSGKINGPGGAAHLLQINPNTLRRRMDKLGITYGRRKQ